MSKEAVLCSMCRYKGFIYTACNTGYIGSVTWLQRQGYSGFIGSVTFTKAVL